MSFQTDNSSEEISGVDVNTAKQKSRGRKHRARNNSPDLGRELSDEEFRDAVKFFKKQRDEELESKVYGFLWKVTFTAFIGMVLFITYVMCSIEVVQE